MCGRRSGRAGSSSSAGRRLLESGADQAAEVRDRHLPPGHRARIVPGADGRTVVLDVYRAG